MSTRAQKVNKMHTIFSNWCRQAVASKLQTQEQYWKLQVASLKSRTSLSLQRAMHCFSTNNRQVALKVVFEAWKEERVKGFQDRFRQLLYETKNKG